MRDHVVADGGQLAVAPSAEYDVLLRLRAPADRSEHLRPTQDELHRTARLLRSHGGKHDVGPGGTLAAEAAADERIDHANIVGAMPSVFATVSRTPETYCVASYSVSRSPSHLRDCRVRLHWVVMLHGRRVDGIDADLRLRATRPRCRPMTFARRPCRLLLRRDARCGPCLLEVESGRSRLVARRVPARPRPTARSKVSATTTAIGCAVVMHDVVLQERQRAAGGRIDRGTSLLRQPGCIASGSERQHARSDAAPRLVSIRVMRPRAMCFAPSRRRRGLRGENSAAIARAARDLHLRRRPDRSAGRSSMFRRRSRSEAPADCRAARRDRVRCASGTLKALSRNGRAPATLARAAAAIGRFRRARCPTSARSGLFERATARGRRRPVRCARRVRTRPSHVERGRDRDRERTRS